MTLNLSDPIMGYRNTDPAVILDHMDRPDTKDKAFLQSLVKWCRVAGIDEAIPEAQFLLETDNGRSVRWNNDLNASGMGIVADSTAQPFYIPDVDAAARLFVQCLYSLVNRKRHPGINLWASTQTKRGGEEWFSDVWLPKVQSSAMPDVRTVSDLGLRYTERGDSRATWSWEDGKVPQDTYGKKLRSRLSEFYPNLPAPSSPPVTTPSTPAEPVEQEPSVATYNYDNGVAPDFKNYEVADSLKYAGWIDPADHFIAAVFIHSAYGSLESSTSWFKGGNALTDYMVGNSFDGSRLDGELRRFNDPYGGRYSWSSGPVNNPIDDAAKFLEIFGPNKEVINMYGTAIERSCAANVATNAVTEKEHAKRCAVIAYHANRYGKRVKQRTGKDGFTCDTFPLIPAENNRSFLIYHGEANAGKRDSCPDQHVRATIDRIIADVRVILAGWQKGTTTIPPQVPPEQMPTYAPVKPIPGLVKYAGMDTDKIPAVVVDGGKKYTFIWDRVKAKRTVPRRQTAEDDALTIGQDIEKGLEFAVSWLFQTDDGTDWYVTPYWTRVKVSDTERIKDAA